MEFIDRIHQLDQNVTLAINSLNCPFTDGIWVLFSDRFVWSVLYLTLVVLFFYKFGWKKALIVLLAAGLTVVACDQLANLCKFGVGRLRPSWDAYMLDGGLHRLEGRGGFYGFFSGHAVNAFGVATSVMVGWKACLGKRRSYGTAGMAAGYGQVYRHGCGGSDRSDKSVKVLGWILYIWAALVAISRVFVGKHFLGDVIVGTIIGLLVGWLMGSIARWIINKYSLSL